MLLPLATIAHTGRPAPRSQGATDTPLSVGRVKVFLKCHEGCWKIYVFLYSSRCSSTFVAPLRGAELGHPDQLPAPGGSSWSHQRPAGTWSCPALSAPGEPCPPLPSLRGLHLIRGERHQEQTKNKYTHGAMVRPDERCGKTKPEAAVPPEWWGRSLGGVAFSRTFNVPACSPGRAVRRESLGQ